MYLDVVDAESKKSLGCDSSSSSSCSASSKEITGRWTAEEHDIFLVGLQLHGKGWKKIAELVKTRTVVQIRTHAQKYFQKMDKANKNSSTSATAAVAAAEGGEALPPSSPTATEGRSPVTITKKASAPRTKASSSSCLSAASSLVTAPLANGEAVYRPRGNSLASLSTAGSAASSSSYVTAEPQVKRRKPSLDDDYKVPVTFEQVTSGQHSQVQVQVSELSDSIFFFPMMDEGATTGLSEQEQLDHLFGHGGEHDGDGDSVVGMMMPMECAVPAHDMVMMEVTDKHHDDEVAVTCSTSFPTKDGRHRDDDADGEVVNVAHHHDDADDVHGQHHYHDFAIDTSFDFGDEYMTHHHDERSGSDVGIPDFDMLTCGVMVVPEPQHVHHHQMQQQQPEHHHVHLPCGVYQQRNPSATASDLLSPSSVTVDMFANMHMPIQPHGQPLAHGETQRFGFAHVSGTSAKHSGPAQPQWLMNADEDAMVFGLLEALQ